MTDPVLKETHVADAVKRLLWQFRDKPNIVAVVESYAVQIQELEYVFMSLLVDRYVSTAEGVQLDGIGGIVGETRQNRTDLDYRVAIQGRILRNRAHSRAEDILTLFRFLLDSHAYELIDGPGVAAFILRIVGALNPSTDPSPAVLSAQLQDAKGAGINAVLQYSEYDDSDTFMLADAGSLQADTNRGTANVGMTYGGYLSGVEI